MRLKSFLLVFLLLACSSPENKNRELPLSSEELSVQGCVEESCAEVKITWPLVSEDKVGGKINQVILTNLTAYFRQDSVFADLQSAAEDFVNSYVDFKNDFPDASGDWNVELTVEKSYESDSLISFKISEFNFSGGAHPNSSINFLTFDKFNGELMTEEDFILDKKVLLDKTEKAFREYHQVPDSISLSEDGQFFLPEGEFFLPNAIGFEDGDLKLIYIPYEIGPYSLGYTTLGFDLNELEGVVKK
ncbi:DUF4163 domain-containing protein [Algoriphagus sp. SE2]|uniref:PdaC/SigV domain-containing protein n=1 Tax=Algoriphagus sp. SE2 TaxID=3141536 RepID=UPI0031CD7AD3